MQTQRDHVHAHQFQMGRMSSALVLGDPASDEIPARRALIGLLAGVLVAVLIVIGFGVYGWLVPGGNTAWRKPGLIIVEKETGSRYVFLGDRLRPVRNLTSAMLILDGGTIKLVSSASLAGVPHGPVIGLEQAPQAPPAPSAMSSGPWLACLGDQARVTVNLDPKAPATPPAAGEFVLLRDGGNRYLVLDGVRHRLGDDAAAAALGVTSAEPVEAPAGWLGGLPEGEAVAAARITGAGAGGPLIGGQPTRIGDLFRQPGVNGAADQLFVLTEGGLSALDRTEFLLLTAASGGTVRDLSAAEVASAPLSGDRSLLGRLPDLSRARLADPAGRAVCARQSSVRDQVTAQVVFADRAVATAAAGRYVPPGSGMVVFALPLPEGANPSSVALHLISDEGVRYRLADSKTVQALKLGGVTPVGMPQWLLDGLPAGPQLSRQAIVEAEAAAMAQEG
jgi:type VII secretion protein EccB